VERVSGYVIADKLDHATAENLKQKTVRSFARIPENKKKQRLWIMELNFPNILGKKQTAKSGYFINTP